MEKYSQELFSSDESVSRHAILATLIFSLAACNSPQKLESGPVPPASVPATSAVPTVFIPIPPPEPSLIPTPEKSAEPPKIVCHPTRVNLEGVTVLPRSKWGAKPADLVTLGTMSNCSNYPIRKITVHHTGEAGETQPGQEAMRLQNAQHAHMNLKHWGDFAYHYAIGLSGEIYEGRNPAFRGDSNTEYYPGKKDRSHTPEHHLLITVIGNYEKQEMTEATRRSLAQMITANLNKYRLSPSDVVGHKDLAYTPCPGKNIMSWLKDWRQASGPRQSPPDNPFLRK